MVAGLIPLCLPLTALFAEDQPVGSCISLEGYLHTMKEFPLADVALHLPTDTTPVGRIRLLDGRTHPPTLELEQFDLEPVIASLLCLARADIDRDTVYFVRVLQHRYGDGRTCISYMEGREHAVSYQQLAHNQAREIQLEAYRKVEGHWRRAPLQSGLPEEALVFECGVRIGKTELIELVEAGELEDGQLLIAPHGPYVLPADLQTGEIVNFEGRTYLRRPELTGFDPSF